MTGKEFIEVLKEKKYSYELVGDRVVVTGGDLDGDVNLRSLRRLPPGVEFKNEGHVDLASLTSLPSGVEFKNKGHVWLRSLTSLPPGVEFKNEGYVDLRSLVGGYFHDWDGRIKGIGTQGLLNLMISKGLFE